MYGSTPVDHAYRSGHYEIVGAIEDPSVGQTPILDGWLDRTSHTIPAVRSAMHTLNQVRICLGHGCYFGPILEADD